MRSATLVFSAALLGTALSSVAASAEDIAPAVPPAMDEVGLTWKRAPKIHDMARQYPGLARALGIRRGLAVVDCAARANGALDCAVAEEDPAEAGFGKAALNVMRRATVQSIDGGSPDGRRFRFRLKFGYWPPAARGDDALIGDSGLRWIRMPSVMKYWNGAGLDTGESFWVEVTCVADADGVPTCEISDPGNGSKGYAAAVLKAMRDARVTTLDDASPSGRTFTYQIGRSIE